VRNVRSITAATWSSSIVSAGANLVKQTIAAILQKSAAPLASRMFMVAKFGSHISLLAKPSVHRRMTRHRSDSDRATR
jgi:hypothetical protein